MIKARRPAARSPGRPQPPRRDTVAAGGAIVVDILANNRAAIAHDRLRGGPRAKPGDGHAAATAMYRIIVRAYRRSRREREWAGRGKTA